MSDRVVYVVKGKVESSFSWVVLLVGRLERIEVRGWGSIMRLRMRHSRILKMLLRLEMVRQFEYVSLLDPGFLSRSMIWASLNLEWKTPYNIERFANVGIISENTKCKDLMSDDGIKSISEDLDKQKVLTFRCFSVGDWRKWTNGGASERLAR